MNVTLKKNLKRGLRAVLVFLVLFLLSGYIVFKSSSVQTFISNKIGEHLSEKTGCEISVREVDFRPFSTVLLKGLLILDHHQDTMLYSGSFSVDITEYDLDEKSINLAFLELDKAHLNIIHYEDEEKNNLQVFMEHLSSDKKNKQDSIKWGFLVENLVFSDLNFTYWDYNHLLKYEGIDYKHVVIKNGAASVNHILFVEGSFMAAFDHLSFEEKSGFLLSDYEGDFRMNSREIHFKDLELKTPNTHIKGQLGFKYNGYDDLKQFASKVKLDSHLENAELNLSDIAYFSPKLTGIDEVITIDGDITGRLNKMKVKNFHFRYGTGTSFEGTASIEGIPDMKNAFIYLKADHLTTNDEDISRIPLPPFKSDKSVNTPFWFKNFGDIVFKGSFTGFLSDFVAYGTFKSDCGIANADVELLQDSLGNTVVRGGIKANKFNLKKLSGSNALGEVSANGAINARFNKEDFLVDFSGNVPLFDLLDYRYSGITMDGEVDKKKFSGSFDINDTNLVMNFNGDINFSKSQQEYKFSADVVRANMHNINWLDRDSSTSISGKIDIDLTGKRIEDINGTLALNNIEWAEKGEVYHMDYLEVKSLLREGKEMILVKSDLFRGKIEGQYDLKEIYPSFINILSKEMPSIVDWEYSPQHFSGKNNFKMMFKLKDYEPIHDLFTPDVDFKGKTSFSGSFDDMHQNYYLNFSSDTFKVRDRSFSKVRLFSHNRDSTLFLKTSVQFAQLFDTVGFENLRVTTDMKENHLNYKISWNNKYDFVSKATIEGEFGLGKIDSIYMHVKDAEINYRNTEWSIDSRNYLVFQNGKIKMKELNFNALDQLLSINGVVGKNASDKLLVNMESFELGNFQYFFNKANIDLVGDATGELNVRGALGVPLVNSDVDILRMRLNNQPFGKVNLNSQYYAIDQRLAIDLTANHVSAFNHGKSVNIRGDYYPLKTDDQLELKANFSNMRLSFMEKYFDGLFSDFKRGKASGNLEIEGSLKRPKFFGNIRLDQMNLKMDYLNVDYAINGQIIEFDDESIQFNDFILSHNYYKDSQAKLSGKVTHEGFKNVKYSFPDVKLNKMIALNTSIQENSTYFGKAFVDGNVYFKGDVNDNYMGGTIKTVSYKNKKKIEYCDITLPLHEGGELELSDFIHFVSSVDSSKIAAETDTVMDVSGLHLDFDFDINTDARVKIVFDPTVEDEINVKGNGQINLQINNDGKFLMNGDYVVQEGLYYFTLRNIIGRKFKVKPGSKISWNGDASEANLDITTYYSTNASLSELIDTTGSNNIDDFNKFRTRKLVNADLFLKGSLWKPIIGMGVSLPDGQPEEVDFLESKLLTEEQVSTQVFSLLLSGRFVGPTNLLNAAGGGAVDNGLQIVEGQLNNALSSIWEGVDLGVDYNQNSVADSSSNSSKDELRLLVGFQYKKFKIKTNYDINNSVGDIQAEYKITDHTRLKAYNKTEEDRLTSSNGQRTLSNTTGVGFLYQKSFNSFRELFKSKAKKEEEQPGSGVNQ